MKVEITKAHWEAAETFRPGGRSARTCPVALAIISQGCSGVLVGRETASFTKGSYRITGALPELARNAVKAFDGKKEQVLGIFEMVLPQERLGLQ